jgi:ankyrin repeat protein
MIFINSLFVAFIIFIIAEDVAFAKYYQSQENCCKTNYSNLYKIGRQGFFLKAPQTLPSDVKRSEKMKNSQKLWKLDEIADIRKGESEAANSPELFFGSMQESLNEEQLFRSCFNGDIKLAGKLLENGVNVNALNKMGMTPLMLAANRHLNIAQLLIEKGANVNAKYATGRTSLHLAVFSLNADIVSLLVSSGANVNAEYEDGETVLMEAASSSSSEIVELLLKNGAEVNASDDAGNTALINAAEGYSEEESPGDTEVVKILLEFGADGAHKTLDGWTALHGAARHNNIEMIEMLVANGVDINAATVEGITPLMCVGKTDTAKCLLSYKANPYLKDAKGLMAVNYAERMGYKEIVHLLSQHK